AALMALLNEINSVGKIKKAEYKTFLQLLSPAAPHITEELWELTGFENMLNQSDWPLWNEEKTVDDVIEIAVQINGKVKGTISISKDVTVEEAHEKDVSDEKIRGAIGDKKVVKEIYVPAKIYNIVVK